jgi:uncharacterized membrane protein
MVRWVVVGLTTFLLLFSAVLSWLMPDLTRRDILFGVTVAPNARETHVGRAIIRRYRTQTVVLTLMLALWLVLGLIVAPTDWWASGLSIGVIAFICVISVLPYLMAYNASRALAASGPPAEAPPSQHSPAEMRHYGDYVPWIWEILPVAIIVGTAAYLATTYAAAPALIPTHFDAAGNANRYSPKNIGTYFGVVWVQLFLEALLTGLALLVAGAKVVPGRAEARFHRTWLRYLYWVKVGVLALFAAVGVATARAALGTTAAAAWLLPATLVLVVVLLGMTLVLALRTGQGGARLGTADETATDRTDDRYWKLGAIYANRSDPAIFVERRFGIGWTLNFGNPRAILVLVAILTAALLPALILVLTGAR